MTEEKSGLRFDIYERVHLSEELEGIESLDEIELSPHIQLEQNGDQTLLKGHLLLSGSYVGVRNGGSSTQLEHYIPVEITMPTERIRNVEEIGVDIENFDVDVLSSRSLNVTGVLSLQGIHSDTAEKDASTNAEEEVVFVHDASDQFSGGSASEAETIEQESREEANVAEQAVEEKQPSPLLSDKPFSAAKPVAEENIKAEEQAEINAEADTQIGAEANEEASIEAEAEEKTAQALPEMKLEFKSKLPELPPEEELSEAEEKDREEELETEDVKSKQQGVEWKSLFLQQDEEQQAFSRVKMCIVQREETLDSIAERYQLNPREIVLYNRLADQQELSAGQIIYIPAVASG